MATALAALMVPLSTWFWSTSSVVTQPYLDEVFHVRQAQHYCAGHFDVWDPKITTPPGLYILSYIASPILGCDVTELRSINAICIDLILLLAVAIYAERPSKPRSSWLVEHCSFNIALFPPLFFFTSLYYTDVASTLSVLAFYWYFVRAHRLQTPSWQKIPVLILLGLFSLSFRQTNIFWVAVFPAGLTLVNHIDRGHDAVKHSMERGANGFGDGFVSIARTSFKMETVYDPPVKDSRIEDYARFVVSLGACLLGTAIRPRRLVSLCLQLMPYIAILAVFASFVIWNGSVVLGDKGNHVATLHLAQMLYIWPYMTFFSWPLIYPYLLALPIGTLAGFSPMAPLEMMLVFKRRRLLPRLSLVAAFTLAACLIVRFNTIVHPFTLADNRHYPFYVFRLLTRPWWVKYAVTPVYALCAWACLQALGAAEQDPGAPNPPTRGPTGARSLQLPDGVRSARISFVLVWLAATALSLVSAPLVEPRYFILPWLFWRLHLPLRPSYQGSSSSSSSGGGGSAAGFDPRLWLETAWLLLVQAATAYVFLYRGFAWPQEPGAVQRFMW